MATPRTRLDRVRASAGIVRLALQQIEDELADDITTQELAQILRVERHVIPHQQHQLPRSNLRA
ncbi:methionine aminopeptidase [Streptomyces sp. V4I2]|nr:methionine aminopeptidase [Streptomyces sp. V4I2]